ncbi:MAG: HAD-IA family hydrolase [Bacillota bacterium]|nr:HAD-IA family hydrolase [Bacillota bacterium]
MALRFNTVIFDMDGTLLDTLDDLADATNHALNTYGYEKRTRDEIRSFVGNGVGLLIRRALPESADENEYQKVLEEFKKYYAVHCNDKTGIYDGISELMKKLKEAGAFIAVVSNKIDSAVQELGELYFPENVDFFIGERAGMKRKPEPDMINEVLRASGRGTDKAVYIGDSEVDIQTAVNSGLSGISVSWGFRDRDFLKVKGAEIIADNTDQVFQVITLDSFAKVFFRLYDRKLCSGEITFSETGMKKDDFTRLCIDEGYVLPYEEISRLCSRMHLTEFETDLMLSFAEKE